MPFINSYRLSLFSPSKISLNKIVTNQIGSVESHEVVPPPSGTFLFLQPNWKKKKKMKYALWTQVLD